MAKQWEEVHDWSALQARELVELRKGEELHCSYVVRSTEDWAELTSGQTLTRLGGWQLFAQPRAPQPLPTEVPSVIRYDDEPLNSWTLVEGGNRWSDANDGPWTYAVDMRVAPFTILEPRGVTARSLLGTIRAYKVPKAGGAFDAFLTALQHQYDGQTSFPEG
jgi:hypothetical protein